MFLYLAAVKECCVTPGLVDPDKWVAYLGTDYRVGRSKGDPVLRIGERSTQVLQLLERSSVRCGAFITGYNLAGTAQSPAMNRRAHQRLKSEIDRRGLACIEGSGVGADGLWPAEKSYFVLGLSNAGARAVGRMFGQDAIVWVGVTGIPRLVLLR